MFSVSRLDTLKSSCTNTRQAVYAPPNVSDGKPRPALAGTGTQSANESPVRPRMRVPVFCR
jgi:hypothetical protein